MTSGDSLAVHFSSKTAEHYTPRAVLDRVLACLGTIELDPCSNPGQPNVPAARHFTAADDGLAQTWDAATLFLNPPYGRSIRLWVEKLCGEHEAGRITEAIALVPARPDTRWFRRFGEAVCCFVDGRLTFLGNDDPAPFPSAIFYLGKDTGTFARCFADLGTIWQRNLVQRAEQSLPLASRIAALENMLVTLQQHAQDTRHELDSLRQQQHEELLVGLVQAYEWRDFTAREAWSRAELRSIFIDHDITSPRSLSKRLQRCQNRQSAGLRLERIGRDHHAGTVWMVRVDCPTLP